MSRKTKKKWSPKMLEMQKNSVSHLLPDSGKKLLMEIEAKHIAAYQEKRTEEGAAGRTVNIEVTTLRSILRRHQQWERVQDDVVMLEEREDVGRALTAEEESTLLLECGRPGPLAVTVRCAGARDWCPVQHCTNASMGQSGFRRQMPKVGQGQNTVWNGAR